MCIHEKDMLRWKCEFEKERIECEAEGGCGAAARALQLRDIHRQPWIQAVVDKVFNA